MHTRPRSRPRALTPIELLLSATATLALLATVLLPLGRSTTEQARIAVCLGNLRNLMVATNLYLADNVDWYPLYVKHGLASWSYGGKTNSDWWLGNYAYYTYAERPLNPYILGGETAGDVVDEYGNIIVRAEVEALRCPSDKTTYSRWLNDYEQPVYTPSYEDLGTSYHFNLFAMIRGFGASHRIDVRRVGMPDALFHGWFWYQHGATILTRDLLREVATRIPSKYAAYHEDPMDAGLAWQFTGGQVVGNHGEFSKHSMGFLDGHAEYRYADTRYFCGPGWYSQNPDWVINPMDPPTWFRHPRKQNTYYYANWTQRVCAPTGGADPAGEPASPATFP